jgi:hypothetical protein
MSLRAEYYRRRGIEAQSRADRATNTQIRLAFRDVADGWFALAEQVDWLDKRAEAECAKDRPVKTQSSED